MRKVDSDSDELPFVLTPLLRFEAPMCATYTKLNVDTCTFHILKLIYIPIAHRRASRWSGTPFSRQDPQKLAPTTSGRRPRGTSSTSSRSNQSNMAPRCTPGHHPRSSAEPRAQTPREEKIRAKKRLYSAFSMFILSMRYLQLSWKKVWTYGD